MSFHEQKQLDRANFLAKFWLKRLVVTVVFLAALTGCERFVPFSSSRPAATPSAGETTSPLVSPIPTASIAPDKPEPTRQVEASLRSLLSEMIDAPVTTTVCPEKTEVKAGDRMECRVTAEAQTFPVVVEFTNNLGAFNWSAKDLLVLSKLEAFIQTTVKDRSEINVTATCGGKIRIAKTGEKFECQVSDQQGRSRPVKVTVKNAQGRVDVTL